MKKPLVKYLLQKNLIKARQLKGFTGSISAEAEKYTDIESLESSLVNEPADLLVVQDEGLESEKLKSLVSQVPVYFLGCSENNEIATENIIEEYIKNGIDFCFSNQKHCLTNCLNRFIISQQVARKTVVFSNFFYWGGVEKKISWNETIEDTYTFDHLTSVKASQKIMREIFCFEEALRMFLKQSNKKDSRILCNNYSINSDGIHIGYFANLKIPKRDLNIDLVKKIFTNFSGNIYQNFILNIKDDENIECGVIMLLTKLELHSGENKDKKFSYLLGSGNLVDGKCQVNKLRRSDK